MTTRTPSHHEHLDEESQTGGGVYFKTDGVNIGLSYQTHVKYVDHDQDGKMCAYAEDFTNAWSMGLGPPVIVDNDNNEVCRLPVNIPSHIYDGNASWMIPGQLITLWYGYNGSGIGDEFYVYEVTKTRRKDLPKRKCVTAGRQPYIDWNP